MIPDCHKCPSCGDTNTESHKDCHDKDNILYDWNLCRKCGEDWMTADQVKAYHKRKIEKFEGTTFTGNENG